MEKATNIIRSSIHSFFASYDTFASIATVLVLPSSASTLLFTALNPSPSSSSSTFLQLISIQKPLPFNFFYLKFLHTTLSFLLTLPFTLTSLSLAKASIIVAARKLHYNQSSPTISSFLRLYRPLALTQLFNTFLILSTNAIFLSVMLLLFNAAESLDSTSVVVVMISAAGVVLYSTIIANLFVICNLASVVAAMENCRAYEAFVKAFVLMRGRAVVALSLALPTNLVMAAIESVFELRVMRPYYQTNQFDLSLMCEGFTITYMYSILTVLDIIITCCFYKFCKYDLFCNYESQFDYEVELGEEENDVLLV